MTLLLCGLTSDRLQCRAHLRQTSVELQIRRRSATRSGAQVTYRICGALPLFFLLLSASHMLAFLFATIKRMRLKSIELSGFKSFARKTELQFSSAVTSIVGPNGSGKSNIAESFRFVLGEQSMKSMRGRRGEDMIWNGSNVQPRGGRASVKLVFDNSDRALNLDFDDVSIERVVHRDGVNEYVLNGSIVRLRDIAELLSQANIGSTGHHIISQGEADRILSATAKERRHMVEDALGLTSFLYKREEAHRKLEKTAVNIREVEGLRRELAPHLKFLQSQVKKIEDSQKLRDDLVSKYLEYLKRESIYLRINRELIDAQYEAPKREHAAIDQKVSFLRLQLSEKRDDARTMELVRLEEKGRSTQTRRDSAGRELGRVEGELTAEERILKVIEETVPGEQVRVFVTHIESELAESFGLAEAELKTRVMQLIEFVRDFLQRITRVEKIREGRSKEELTERKAELEEMLATMVEEESRITTEVAALRTSIEGEKDANREAERELFAAMARRSELEVTLNGLRNKKELLTREEEMFKSEMGEAVTIVGRAVHDFEQTLVRDARGEICTDIHILDEPRAIQEDRRKKIERQKIRLEEAGLGNAAEVLREHAEALERDNFLARELTDLTFSTQSLNILISELTQTLSVRFGEGIAKINTEFNSFFTLMFAGGSAALKLVEAKSPRKNEKHLDILEDETSEGYDSEDESDEDEPEEGIDITITLPHKRLKGLHVLSGGERALTSIALIFAMSQVNPPPFLILDETDAALDEANSRRYGEMISTLAKKSQLILITHNRETMSRAGILYGITMGSDGVSKLLSVKFEDALAVAK